MGWVVALLAIAMMVTVALFQRSLTAVKVNTDRDRAVAMQDRVDRCESLRQVTLQFNAKQAESALVDRMLLAELVEHGTVTDGQAAELGTRIDGLRADGVLAVPDCSALPRPGQ